MWDLVHGHSAIVTMPNIKCDGKGEKVMDILIHDIDMEQFQLLFPKADKRLHIISDTGNIRNCIGCFGCWIKTPGKCVLRDEYNNIGVIFAQAENVFIISRCYYGGYSPFVKNILDRSIPYLLPFFKIMNNETHHKRRYKNNLQFSVYFYGDKITIQERKTAQDLVKANALNFNAKHYQTTFIRSLEELPKEVIDI